MNIIKKLPKSVANQIAAGEVIQRPSSIVKELIENSIDAKSNVIKVVIKESGKQSINVIDDGVGMSKTDSVNCFERHSTSKLSKAEDLLNNKTITKITFKIIGAAAASANLLWELSIAEKKDANEISNKNGNVILVKFIVIFNFSPFSIKPGAIIKTKIGIKISIIKTINKRPKINKLNTLLANLFACFFPLFNSDM